MKRILIVYKSVTGFTKRYAEWIARETGAELTELRAATARQMNKADVVIFGGRFHAGRVDGLKRAKELFRESGAAELVVFATGATPDTAEDLIREAWKNNFTPEELEAVPHFYMQSGLCYERMPFGDKLMMKVFAAMLKRQKDDSTYAAAMREAVADSSDYSDPARIRPLLEYLGFDGQMQGMHKKV